MDDAQLRIDHDRKARPLETGDITTLSTALDQLRHEVADLRASRERLILFSDEERRRIERELHAGVQQHLIALAVSLQLATQQLDTDPVGARAVLDEMGRDLDEALGDAARIAERIHPALLEAGLGVALRAAATSTDRTVSVEIASSATYPDAVARTVYLCCVEALAHVSSRARASIVVREERGYVLFEVVVEDVRRSAPSTTRFDAELEGMRDRVEALGGRLTVASTRGGIRLSGSLPVS